MIRSVIFDMDGTLIDTEKYYRKYWVQACAEFGYTMTDEMVLSIRSLGRPFAPARFREWFGEDFDYWKVRERRKELVRRQLDETGIELKPGAVEILTWLRANGYQTAIATANGLERTKGYLEELGLAGYFDELCCATEVKEGKPSPDVYLFACEKLGKKPEECIAVEDSPNGIRSAYRAGCKVVMVPDQTQPDEELRKMLFGCVDTLDRIRDLLEER